MMESDALEQKINQMRLKNEAIRRRYEEVEADKKHAAQLNALVKLVPSGDWPERKEPPEFTAPPVNAQKFKPPNNERPQHPFQGSESKKSHKFAEGDGPPPDPKYNFLADSEREIFNTNENEEQDEEEKGAFNASKNRRGGPRRRGGGRGGRDTYYRENKVVFPSYPKERGHPQHDVWRTERHRIDEARVSRQKTVEGSWRREWDVNKVYSDKESPRKSSYEKRTYDQGDYSNRGNGSRTYQSQKGSYQEQNRRYYNDQQRYDNDATYYNNGSRGPVMSVKVNSSNIVGTGRVGPRQKSRVTYSSQADAEDATRDYSSEANVRQYGDRKFHRTRYSGNRRRDSSDQVDQSIKENRSAPPKYSKSNHLRNNQKQNERYVGQETEHRLQKEEDTMVCNENIEDENAKTVQYYESKNDYDCEDGDIENPSREYYESNKDYYESNQEYKNYDVYDDNNAATEYYESNQQEGGGVEYGEFSEYTEDSNKNISQEIIDHEQHIVEVDDEPNQEIAEENSEKYEFVEDDNRDVEHDSNEGSYKDVKDENITNSQSCESTEFSNKELGDENTDSCNVEEKESQDSDYLDAMSNEPSAQNTPIHKETDLKVIVSFEQDNEILQVVQDQDIQLKSGNHDDQSNNQVIFSNVQESNDYEPSPQMYDNKVEKEISLLSNQESENYPSVPQIISENLAERDEEKDNTSSDVRHSKSFESLPKTDEVVEDEVVPSRIQEGENYESLSPTVEKFEETAEILPNVQESENYESLSPIHDKVENPSPEISEESTSPSDPSDDKFNDLFVTEESVNRTSTDEQLEVDVVQSSVDLAQEENSTLHDVECYQQDDDGKGKDDVRPQRPEEHPEVHGVLKSCEVESESDNLDVPNETKKLTSIVISNTTCDDSGFVDDHNDSDSLKIKGKVDPPHTILESETKEEALENCDITPEPVNESNLNESTAEPTESKSTTNENSEDTCEKS